MELANYSTLNVQERNSVRSNFINNDYSAGEKQEIPWIGLLIFHTYVVDLRNLTKNKLFICKEYHIQPSEIDRMQFWQYEWYTDEIKEITKEQEKQQKAQEKEQKAMQSSMNPNSMMRNMQSSMPKMPSMSMPNFSMPKI